MIHPVDDRLRDEARRFRLAFGCPSCAWDDQTTDRSTRRCALGYPNEAHVDEQLEGRLVVIFCKTFELA